MPNKTLAAIWLARPLSVTHLDEVQRFLQIWRAPLTTKPVFDELDFAPGRSAVMRTISKQRLLCLHDWFGAIRG